MTAQSKPHAEPLMTFEKAAQILLCSPSVRTGAFSSVCIDSRTAVPGALFVALNGEQTDGHRFVEDALRRGAAGVVADTLKIATFSLESLARHYNAALLPVEKPLAALQSLAAAYLDSFPRLLRLGITGSSGKTTTKEIALAICRLEKETIANAGNLNSDTGLPLSVFEVRACHQMGIFEAGMNRKGEIAELARVLRPDLALITNTGSAHIGCIGSREGIALEKKAIFSQFSGKETALIDADDTFAALLAEGVNGNIRYFGEKQSSNGFQAVSRGLHGWEFAWQGEWTRFPLTGAHNLRNALAAAALASAAGISDGAIRAGLAKVKPLFGRGEIIEGVVTVIRDCYNANPESATQALSFCDGLDWQGARLYVFGSMLELGNESEKAHRELGTALAHSKADALFLFGEEMEPLQNIIEAAGKFVLHTNNIDKLRHALREYAKTGSLILLKGSRGCALERAWEEHDSC